MWIRIRNTALNTISNGVLYQDLFLRNDVANKDPNSVKIFCVGDKSRGFMQRFLKVTREKFKKIFLFVWLCALNFEVSVSDKVKH